MQRVSATLSYPPPFLLWYCRFHDSIQTGLHSTYCKIRVRSPPPKVCLNIINKNNASLPPSVVENIGFPILFITGRVPWVGGVSSREFCCDPVVHNKGGSLYWLAEITLIVVVSYTQAIHTANTKYVVALCTFVGELMPQLPKFICSGRKIERGAETNLSTLSLYRILSALAPPTHSTAPAHKLPKGTAMAFQIFFFACDRG